MPRVVHFEIGSDDPDRAAKFYKDLFGWKIEKWSGPQDYWLVTTGEDSAPGINGGISHRMHPGMATVNTIDVENVDDIVQKIKDAGGKILAPKMTIPGVGYLAYAQDTEGNVFGVMQSDRGAK